MKQAPKMPIWMLITISVLGAVLVLAVILQLLLQITIPGLIPFLTAALIVPIFIGYFQSPKKDKMLLAVMIVAMIINVANGILQLMLNT